MEMPDECARANVDPFGAAQTAHAPAGTAAELMARTGSVHAAICERAPQDPVLTAYPLSALVPYLSVVAQGYVVALLVTASAVCLRIC